MSTVGAAQLPREGLPILQIVQRDGIVDLGWGHPDPELLPVAAVRRAADAVLSGQGHRALQYGFAAGPGPLLEWLIARIARDEGRRPAPEDILITGGSSLALDQLLALLVDPGDTVMVEAPTYHLAVRILRDHPIRLEPVPTDESGLDVAACAARVQALKAAGRRIRALYIVPTFSNPRGGNLAPERRIALLELAAREGFLILEDDVYRELAYDGAAPPSLWSRDDAGVVVRMGSFSKTLAPGLRVGWLTGPAALVQRIARCGLLDSGGGTNHFSAMLISALCANGDYEPQVARLREAYRARRDALDAALRARLDAGFAWQKPGGGFFMWLQMPVGLTSEALLSAAETRGMSFVEGRKFFVDEAGRNHLRLAFTLYPPEQLALAADRLGAAAAALTSA